MSGARRRILIVDDHAAVRRGLRTLIESDDRYEIVGEASDGHSALEMAQENRPHIVTLDYSLPCLNGFEVAHRLKRDMPRIEILLYTLHDGEDFLHQMLWAGIRAYVPKSDPTENVLAALEAISSNRPYLSGLASEALLDQLLAAAPQHCAFRLTIRERVVAQQIAEGRMNKQVAHELGLSIKTVESHRANIMHKLKLRTTADLVRYAIKNNIVMA
ncbi:MAG: response regulator [Sphingomicrobium sp.]